MSKAPPDGSRNSLVRPKPLLILREELVGEGLGYVFTELVTQVTLQDLSIPDVQYRWINKADRGPSLQRLKEEIREIRDVFLWQGSAPEASLHFFLLTSPIS